MAAVPAVEAAEPGAPALSVVVALTSGRVDHLRRHLDALLAQAIDQAIEVVVPYDSTFAAVTVLAGEYPAVRFVRADGLSATRRRRGDSPEFIDTLRTLGLRAARGEVVGLTEDWAVPDRHWIEAVRRRLGQEPTAGAVGGAIECEHVSVLAWAVWFCDFFRYQRPLPSGPTAWASDTNVVYRRAALERVAAAWAGDYHEPVVHAALEDAGIGIHAAPDAVMTQARGDISLWVAIKERFVWARSFAGVRARAVGARRWLLAMLCPALPVVLTWRVVTTTVARGSHRGRLIACLPAIILLQSVWTLGEFVGYVTAEPQ